jgi:hypothetical protein
VEANLSFNPTALYAALQTRNPTIGDDSGSSTAAPVSGRHACLGREGGGTKANVTARARSPCRPTPAARPRAPHRSDRRCRRTDEKYPASADLHAIAAAAWDVGSTGRCISDDAAKTCCVAGFGASLAAWAYDFIADGRWRRTGAQFCCRRTMPKKKAGPRPCFEALTKCRSTPIGIFMEWPRFFRAAGFPPTDLDRNLRSAILLRTHAPFSG